jgi:Ca2+:H+ antiporter
VEAGNPQRPGSPSFGPGFLATPSGWPYLLAPFIPIAIALRLFDASAGLIFFSAALGVIPTAALMGRATEEVAAQSGPGIGGLLNVTFGNAPELIIALFALEKGLHEVVKASIIGSILGNILLVMGAAMLAGGLVGGRKVQRFDRTAANMQSLMLILAVAALVMPAIFELVEGQGLPGVNQERVSFDSTVEHLSIAVAIVLIITYAAGLVFSLKTHRELFNPHSDEADGKDDDIWGWSMRTSVIALALAGVAVGVMSEILVGSIEETSHSIGLSEFFIGVIVVAIVGNAAEHWVAVWWRSRTRWTSRSISRSVRAPRSRCSSPRCWCCLVRARSGPMPWSSTASRSPRSSWRSWSRTRSRTRANRPGSRASSSLRST